MSLLMDALKKAELAKRQGQSGGAVEPAGVEAQSGLALEPIANTPQSATAMPAAESASSAGNLPHLPSHLEELDAKFLSDAQQAAAARLRTPPTSPPVSEPLADKATVAITPPRKTAAAEPRRTQPDKGAMQNQSAAQNLFAAKQANKPPPARKGFAITIGVLTVLAVCGIGGYFWWQLQPKAVLVASRGPLPIPTPATTSSPVTGSPSVPAAVSSAPTLAAPPVAPVAGVPGAAHPATPVATDKDDDSAVAAIAPTQTRRAISAPAASPEPESPIRVTKAPLKVNPALMRGFDAFNRGDLAVAQTEYERAQKSDPRNTDALHGLAAIAVRQGRVDQAEWLYRQITEADPQDTVAMSALINMRAQIDQGAAESRLKSLSAAQPELAAPQFSLGNVYARNGRWNEAQQAYFRAYSAEPDNPDILYNLAISLEHLRQNKLAAQYYTQAIAAAQTRPAGFDKAQATARLSTLQP
jgi:Flp pilus assembly protein TadD